MPVNSPKKWNGDNLGMLQSSNIPEAMLKKRHVNIAYHMCHEQVAANVLTPIMVRTGDNVADTATKALEGSALGQARVQPHITSRLDLYAYTQCTRQLGSCTPELTISVEYSCDLCLPI